MNLVSRIEATKTGSTRFFTGRPCRNGHLAERYTNSNHCVECVANQRRQWKNHNPEKTYQHGVKYQRNNVEKCRAASLRSYYKNPDRCKTWKENNIEKVRAAGQRWQRNNPAKVTANASKRRAHRIQRTPKWADFTRIQDYYDVCNFFNSVNGYIKYHVDHIIPLRGKTVSGLHVHNNLQVILAEDNLRKGNTL